MNSMTGFGRAEAEKYGHKITIELKSVNHRFLEINIRMPRFIMFLEDAVRQTLKDRLSRGRVDVFVNYEATGNSAKSVKLDMDIAKGYLAAAEKLAAETGIVNDLTASTLLKMPEVIAFDEERQDEDELKEVMLEAENIARIAKDNGIEHVYTFDNNKDATEKLKKIIAVDDVALIKASNSMNFKEIVASLLQH